MVFLNGLHRRFKGGAASQAPHRFPTAAPASHPGQSASTRRASNIPAGVDISRIYADKDNPGDKITTRTARHVNIVYEEPWLGATHPTTAPLRSFDRPDELHAHQLFLHPLTYGDLRRNYEIVPRVRDDPVSKPILRMRNTPRPTSSRSNSQGGSPAAHDNPHMDKWQLGDVIGNEC